MKVKFTLKRVHVILAALLLLNVVAYLTVSSFSKQAKQEISTEQKISEAESYFHSGVKVLNWSYSMLQYFRHRGTDNT